MQALWHTCEAVGVCRKPQHLCEGCVEEGTVGVTVILLQLGGE